ncbi:MAG: ferrous iron transporter B [Treponema sp.]|nr:ferrous iron transporter B [Treponema sp.]
MGDMRQGLDPQSIKNSRDILLVGNPNVGKSVIFTELTGVHAISSNYTGTTVQYTEGPCTIGGNRYRLLDLPGTYSLKPASPAEELSLNTIQEGARAIIFVLDATNLERNLALALELQGYGIPLVYALNLNDVAQRRGIGIDSQALEAELGSPVTATVAVRGEGLKELVSRLEEVLAKELPAGGTSHQDIWGRAREIKNRVSQGLEARPGFLERLSLAMIKPFPGIPIALVVMALSIGVILGLGRQLLHETLLLPLVEEIIVPFFQDLFSRFIPPGVFLNILIGEYGIFAISFEWILALIFPYVLVFYIVFTFLEDTGFLPRLSVLFDNLMRKAGIQGGSLIHILLAYGCAVPAILSSRTATSRKERIIITTAICFAIPCIAQTGAIISLLSAYAWWMLPLMLITSFVLFVSIALATGKLIKGRVDPLILEVPNLLLPNPRAYGRKLLTRMKHFIYEAEAPMLVAVVLAALLSETGLLEGLARAAQPLIGTWLGMPPEAVMALLLGIIRREMSVAPLLALDLSSLQAYVGALVSLMYLPCISVFAILYKEFKMKVALGIAAATVGGALLTGGLVNQIAQLFIK